MITNDQVDEELRHAAQGADRQRRRPTRPALQEMTKDDPLAAQVLRTQLENTDKPDRQLADAARRAGQGGFLSRAAERRCSAARTPRTRSPRPSARSTACCAAPDAGGRRDERSGRGWRLMRRRRRPSDGARTRRLARKRTRRARCSSGASSRRRSLIFLLYRHHAAPLERRAVVPGMVAATRRREWAGLDCITRRCCSTTRYSGGARGTR